MDDHVAPGTIEPGTALATPASTSVAPLAHGERIALAEVDTVRMFVDRTLDAVDEIADAVAQGLGLRDR